MSKIYEQLYIGSINEMRNSGWLDAHHITHIVNCPKGVPSFFPDKYSYINLVLDDVPEQSLYGVLEPAFEFIKRAIANGGTVLVACHAGISRSVSVVLYFLMKVRLIHYEAALEVVRAKRSIANPNPGFAQQLISVSPQVRSRLNHPPSYQQERKYGIPW